MSIIAIPKPIREKLGDDGADALVELLNQNNGDLSADIIQRVEDRFARRVTETEARLRQEITETAAGLRQEMYALKTSLIKWIIGLLFAQTAILLGILSFAR